MEGKEAIINKIIEDAEKKSASIIDNAKFEGGLLIKEAEKWATEYTSSEEEKLKTQKQEIISRRLTVADLDIRKIILQKKQDFISEILDKIFDGLLKVDKKIYSSYVEKCIGECFDCGDEIILSRDKVLTKEEVENFKVVKENKLKVSDKLGDFVGGVYLVGKLSDKDLSFKAIIERNKEQLISNISEKLFN